MQQKKNRMFDKIKESHDEWVEAVINICMAVVIVILTTAALLFTVYLGVHIVRMLLSG